MNRALIDLFERLVSFFVEGGLCVGVADVIQSYGHKFNNWLMVNVGLPSYGFTQEVSNHKSEHL